MIFACIFVPDFPAAALVRSNPDLDESPVAILDGSPPLVKIISTNRIARTLGAQIGMTKLQAESVSALNLRRRSPEQETAAHAALLDCAYAFSPRVEDTKTSGHEKIWRDTVLLDIAGLEKLFGAAQKIACDIAHRAYQLGLEARVAVAQNPEAAIHAARGFPGITVIPLGEEQQRLGPLPIEVLEPAAELLETFDRWGIRTFADLAHLPAIAVNERIGSEGIRLQTLARGGDDRPLVTAGEPLHFQEVMELEDPVDSLEPLAFIFGRLLDQLCARLSARALSTNELRLALELETSQREARQFHHRTLKLPLPLLDSKIFLKLLQLDLQSHPPQKPVTRVSLTAKPARPRTSQGGLFVRRSPEPERLQLTLARIAAVVGKGNAGSPELLDTHRPDAFRMIDFAFDPNREVSSLQPGFPILCTWGPQNSKRTGGREIRPPQREAFGGRKGATSTTLRLFRPPLAANVELRNDVPSKILFSGNMKNIISYAGPWQTSGDWWTTSSWSRDEWDVALSIAASPDRTLHPLHAGYPETGWPILCVPSLQHPELPEAKGGKNQLCVYRIFRDLTSNRWFVEGSYD